MSNKRNILLLIVALLLTIAAQVYFIANYDHFKAEGGLSLEMKIEPQDILGKYARASLDYDYVMKDVVMRHEQSGENFFDALVESNKGKRDKPLVSLFNYKEIEELSIDSKDDEVVTFLKEEIKESVGLTENALQTKLETMLDKDVDIRSDIELLEINVLIAGLNEPFNPSVLTLPKIKLGFYECASMSEFGDFWNTICLLSEPTDSSEQDRLVQMNKGNGLERKSLFNAVRWEQNTFGIVADRDKKIVENWISSEEVVEQIPNGFEFQWSVKKEMDGEDVWFLYIIKIPREGNPRISNDDIRSALFHEDGGYGEPVIDLMMTHEGAEKWEEMTSENLGRLIAMSVNDVVFSAPHVAGVISGGRTQISGGDAQSLRDIEIALNAKALDVYPELTEQKMVAGNPPVLNVFVQQILLAISIILLLVVLGRFFMKSTAPK